MAIALHFALPAAPQPLQGLGHRKQAATSNLRGRAGSSRTASTDTFCAPHGEISEQKRQLERSAAEPEAVDLEWCEPQLLDLTSAWEAADSGQRSRLVGGVFEHLEAEALPEGTLRVVAVPREAWRPFLRGWYWSTTLGLIRTFWTCGRDSRPSCQPRPKRVTRPLAYLPNRHRVGQARK